MSIEAFDFFLNGPSREAAARDAVEGEGVGPLEIFGFCEIPTSFESVKNGRKILFIPPFKSNQGANFKMRTMH